MRQIYSLTKTVVALYFIVELDLNFARLFYKTS